MLAQHCTGRTRHGGQGAVALAAGCVGPCILAFRHPMTAEGRRAAAAIRATAWQSEGTRTARLADGSETDRGSHRPLYVALCTTTRSHTHPPAH
eukprot:1310230-Prymnesium_polylepis.1